MINPISRFRTQQIHPVKGAIFSCLLWSTAFVGVKIGLQYSPPLQFAGIRFLVAGFIILLFVGKMKETFKQVKLHFRYLFLLGIFQTFLQYSLFYIGLNMVPAAIAAIVIGSGPLFVSLIAHFFMDNDKLSWYKSGSIIWGILGIVFISLGRNQLGIAVSSKELIGIAILILNNLISGYSNVMIVRSKIKMNPFIMSGSQMILGAILMLILAAFVEGIQFKNYPLEYYLSSVWLSLLSATAISIWFVLLNQPGVKVSLLNTWKFIIPVFGAVLAWLILPNESPDWITVIGMLITTSSLLLINKKRLNYS